MGGAFDLPIALGVLAASGLLPLRHLDDILVLGELSFDGAVRSVLGTLPIAARARRGGVRSMVLPTANATEASLVSGLTVVGVTSLREAVAVLTEAQAHPSHRAPQANGSSQTDNEIGVTDLADVKGQALARRALEIAAAGGHNLLFVGPPPEPARACSLGACQEFSRP